MIIAHPFIYISLVISGLILLHSALLIAQCKPKKWALVPITMPIAMMTQAIMVPYLTLLYLIMAPMNRKQLKELFFIVFEEINTPIKKFSSFHGIS